MSGNRVRQWPPWRRPATWPLMLAVVAAFAIGAAPARSRADDLRVFSSGAPSIAIRNIANALAGNSGDPTTTIRLTVAPPGTLAKRIASGETADVIVAPAQALAALEKDGKVLAGSRTAIARVGVGVAVRRGVPLPDVVTTEALRIALLAAPSIVYPDPGQPGSVAGRAIARMLDQLGIAEAVKPKTTLKQAIAGGVEMVARGEAAIGLFNISEILPIEGVALAGPLPKDVQFYITFEGAILAGTPSEAAARAYLLGLMAAASRPHWEAAGLEAVAGAQ